MERINEEVQDTGSAYIAERETLDTEESRWAAVTEQAQVTQPKPKVEQPVQTIDETGDDSGFFSIVGDTLKGTVAGPVEATKEALEAVTHATAWGAEQVGVDTNGPAWDTLKDLSTPDGIQPEGTAGHVAKGLTQFLTGFIPAYKLAKAAKMGSVAAGFAGGGAADAVVFEPNDPNLTRFLADNDWVAQPVEEFLATDPTDSEAYNRLRNVVEGGVLGIIGEAGVRGLMSVFKAYRATGAANQAIRNPDNVEIPDEVINDLGDDVQAEFVTEDVAVDTTSIPDTTVEELFDFHNAPEVQEVTSAATDVNYKSGRMPASIKKIQAQEGFVKGGINADIGGGAGDVIAKHLKETDDVTNIVYDPFNRSAAHNADAVAKIANGQADTATINNVLNVIKEPEVRKKVVQQAHNALKEDGKVYIITYEGNKSGIGADTKAGHQLNQKTADYVKEIEEVFGEGNVTVKSGMITAVKKGNKVADEVTPKAKPVEQDNTPKVGLSANAIDDMADQAINGPNAAAAGIDDTARSFNQEYINSSEDIRKLLDITDEGAADVIDQAKRGTQSLADTKRNAKELSELTGAPIKKINELYDSTKGLDYKMLHARQALLSSATELVNIAKIASASGTPQDMVRVRRQMAIHAALQAEVKGAQTEIARALNAMKVGADANDAFETLSLLGGDGVSQKTLQRIIELADSPAKLNKFTRKGVWAKSRDAVTEYFINSILSGPATQVVNITSNGLFAIANNAERYLAAGMNKALKQDGVTFGEARAQTFGMYQGLKDAMFITDEGFKALAKAGKEAVSTMPKRVVDEVTGEAKIVSEGWNQAKDTLKGKQDEFGNALRTAVTEEPIVDNAIKFEHHVENSAISAQSLGASGVLGQGVDMLGSMIRTPGRALLTGDEFFKSIGYRMELNAQAYRRANQQGLTGDALAAEVARIVENPPKDIHLSAIDGARYQTYTKELGETGAKFQQLVASMPVLRFVVPFIRTPTNILKAVAERTPGANLLLDNVRDDLMAGGARAQLATSRMAMGTSMYTLAGFMASGDDPLIIGGGPSNPASRKGWLADGKQPYSIRIGDEWHAFNRMDPFGSFFGLAADLVAISGNVSEQEMDELTADALAAFMKNVGSKTYVQGLIMWSNALTDPERFGPQLLKQYAAAFVPNALAQTNRAEIDTTARSAFTMLEAMQAKIPGWSKDLPARLDLFGEPVIYQGGLGPDIMSPIYTSSMKDDPVRDEIARLEVPIAYIAKSLDGIELDSQQHHDLSKFSAEGLHDALEKEMNSYEYVNRLTDNQGEFEGSRQMRIRNIIAKHNEKGRRKFLEANPEFTRKTRALLTQKRAALGSKQAERQLTDFSDLIPQQ